MLTLIGFPASNYCQVVSLALLEKAIPHDERHLYPLQDPDFRRISPMGKYPCLETPHGTLTETSVILDYLEETFPAISLWPEDPFRRAKARELNRTIELYIDLAARRMLPQLLLGRTLPDEVSREARSQLGAGVRALARLASFSPYVYGDTLTYADLSLYCHVPFARRISQTCWQEDPFEGVDGLEACLARLSVRPAFQRVSDAAEADRPAFFEYIATLRRQAAP